MPGGHEKSTRCPETMPTDRDKACEGYKRTQVRIDAPLVAHVDVSRLFVEEAELGFLLPRVGIVRLLLALRLFTNPRHGELFRPDACAPKTVLSSRGFPLLVSAKRTGGRRGRAKSAMRRLFLSPR